MSEDEIRRIAGLFKVLADESRLQILGILARGPCTGGALAERVDLGASTVSHHLTRLREAGLVTSRSEGNTRIYALDRDALAALSTEVLDAERIAAAVPEGPTDRAVQKVLDAFLDRGHLTRIPANRRKRAIVLDWLVERFPLETDLTEAEVNETIQAVHWDSATLRRELIGGGWMTRADGVYRRVR